MSLMTNQLLHEGTKKSLYTGSNNDRLILAFKDSIPELENSGIFLNLMNERLFSIVKSCSIPNHFIQRKNLREHEVHNTSVFPFYLRITNIVTQSVHSLFNLEMGTVLKRPLVEFTAKQDGSIKVIEQSYLLMFDWCQELYLNTIKQIAHRVNDVLRAFFFQFGVDIAQCTLRFGLFEPEHTFDTHNNEKILLINDLTPHQFILWHTEANDVLTLNGDLMFNLGEYMRINMNHCNKSSDH